MFIVVRGTLLVLSLLAAALGVAMARGTAGRGNVVAKGHFNRLRTVLMPQCVVGMFAEAVAPSAAFLTSPITTFGVVVLVCAAALRVLAQAALGPYWSADIVLREDHQLVTDGPYEVMRHPIYTSYVFLALGVVLATSNIFLTVLMSLYAVASLFRIPDEEQVLVQRFGGKFLAHRKAIVDGWATFTLVCLFMWSIGASVYGELIVLGLVQW